MPEALLTGRGLSRDHRLPRTRLFAPAPVRRVLHEVDIDVHADRTLAVIGESGSGKSTLVRILLGLQRPTEGSVHFDGQPVDVTGSKRQHWLRRRTGIVLQDPYASLDPRLSIAQIIHEPLRSLAIPGDHRRLIAEALERVGLSGALGDAHPHELSGGQRQRVAIARAIVHGPDLLIGDEPMSALDVTIRASILELLQELRAAHGMGLVLVSHDLGLVRHFADEVMVLHEGRVVDSGPAASLFTDSSVPYTRSLVAAIPRLEAGPGPRKPPTPPQENPWHT